MKESDVPSPNRVRTTIQEAEEQGRTDRATGRPWNNPYTVDSPRYEGYNKGYDPESAKD